ncbi:O-methyltransferase [Mangrovibacillus cuniculi]|uniref:tRNA 5-hydroxyuridine methyltransferase n=1 Tax=Mangrovibacillus cuniculi TaxID=2593652 RepID=A0A7S8HFM5_9BACI|nr:O-methyltransferase [Mangrovibacillus cuniculi]QPC46988.1 O-methyltransferase [Mangrovibacillus cuniculi]
MENAITNYLSELVQPRESLFQDMEQYATEHHVPIMDIVGMETLLQLLRVQKPKKILEVGAAIGYSGLRMADTLPNVTIITIERDEERATVAKQYIQTSNLAEQISLIQGDALEVVEEVKMHGPYDAIFIDAAKGQYQRFFDLYAPMLSEQGVIYTDNVLFKGLVATPEEEVEQIEPKRIRQLVKKIKSYNHWLMNHEEYYTMIVPVGDGLAITTRRVRPNEEA